MTFFDLIVFYAFFLLFGTIIVVVFAKLKVISTSQIKLVQLALHFRMLTTLAYFYFTLYNSGDAVAYYRDAENANWEPLLEPGTAFITNLSILLYPFTSIFENSYLMMYVPFSLCGFTGSILFYSLISKLYKNVKKDIEACIISLFLPNVIFWSSNLGKDSVIYMGTILLLYIMLSNLSLLKSIFLTMIGGFIVFMVRPHIFLFLMFSFIFGLFLERKGLTIRNVFVSLIALVLCASLYEVAFKYVGLDVSVEKDQRVYDESLKNIERRANNLNQGGARINRSSFSTALAPLYGVQFLFGPFIWQARKPVQVISAIESWIYQLMVVLMVVKYKTLFKSKTIPYKYCIIIYIILATLVMGTTFTNFGLTVRQKNMVIPYFTILFAYVRVESFQRKKKTQKQQILVNEKLMYPTSGMVK